MRNDAQDTAYMRLALSQARRAFGFTSPNPAVGALLVAAGQIIARGHHRRAGSPHAEVECLRGVDGLLPANAILYVTLEPCSTTGRTPPCTAAIIEAGLKRVVIGASDPNPRHRGAGIRILREHGIEVQCGVLEDECEQLNEAFNKWIATGQPFVIAKCGMSLDGHLTRPSGEDQWITNAEARRHARELRAQVDAILVGAETIRRDDPKLTARPGKGGRQPWRVVVTRSGKLPPESNVFTDASADRTLVLRKQPLDAILRVLGQKEILSVLIEGGGDILSQALEARLLDKAQIYIGSLLSGGPVVAFAGKGAGSTAEATRIQNVSYEKIGNDVCLTGYVVYPKSGCSETFSTGMG